MDQEQIKAFFAERDRFARHNDMEVVEVSEGRAVTRMTIGPQHLNGVDMAHGGAIFTLADLAFAAASNSHNRVSVAINATISFHRAAREGILVAEAEEVSLHAKLSSYLIRVRDGDGDLIATFQGMTYRKRDPLI